MPDLVIIGAGPAGLAAAIYAKRFGLDCILIENLEQPSQMSYASEVENYPGFERISGMELLEKMRAQARKLGAKIIAGKVIDIKAGKGKRLVVTDSSSYEAKAIIIATGAKKRTAGIPGEAEFLGKGVSYCATCDGMFFKGKEVVVWGGGNTALSYASYLKSIGCTVTLVHRREEFRADKAAVDKARKAGVKFLLGRTIKAIKGKKMVEAVELDDGKEVKCSGIFIAIGEVPAVELFKKLGVKVDENSFIVVDSRQGTNLEGIYAAGDVTAMPFRQISTAVGAGANAAFGAYNYLQGLKK